MKIRIFSGRGAISVMKPFQGYEKSCLHDVEYELRLYLDTPAMLTFIVVVLLPYYTVSMLSSQDFIGRI